MFFFWDLNLFPKHFSLDLWTIICIPQTKYPTKVTNVFQVKMINMLERSTYILYFKYEFYPPYAWTIEIERTSGDLSPSPSLQAVLIIKGGLSGFFS